MAQSQINQYNIDELRRALSAGQQSTDVEKIGELAREGIGLSDRLAVSAQERAVRAQALQKEIAELKAKRIGQSKISAFGNEPSNPALRAAAFPKEEAALQADLELQKRRSQLELQKAPLEKKIGLTPGQESADKEFGKDYNAYVAQGGSKGAAANFARLESAINKLSNIEPSAGFGTQLAGLLPDSARGIFTPELKTIEQDARTNVLGMLRQTLGPQFTEKEGERIFAQTYDPTLRPNQNAARLRSLAGALQESARDKEAAIRYFEQNGTLSGFSGQLPSFGGNPNSGSPSNQVPKVGDSFQGSKVISVKRID